MNDTFQEDEACDVLIRPRRSKRDPWFAPDLILAMTGPVLDLLVKILAARSVPVSGAAHYRVYEVGKGDRPRPALAGPFLGAPQAVLGLEKMIALGARRVWVTGWCGSLQPDLRIGDLVMPLDAFSDEGTSRHYPLTEAALNTDQGLRRKLISALERRGRSARTGRLWSTDAPYRETHHKVQSLMDAGLVAVDMELSALLTVAAYRGVRLAALLVISDELFDLSWRHAFSSPLLREAEEDVARVLEDVIGR